MFFTLLNTGDVPKTAIDQAFLFNDDWDDWFKYETKFWLVYVDKEGKQHGIGSLKIGQFEMGLGQKRPILDRKFNRLNEIFFSLGQDDSYYEDLKNLGDNVRDKILFGLNDVAKDLNLFERALKENVTKVSLLRSVALTSVYGQFHRLTSGGARLSKYDFKYTSPQRNVEIEPIEIDFHVEPESNPPTNIHVLIGRNGVGKTYMLNNMINSLLNNGSSSGKFGSFSSTSRETNRNIFANLVSVTFSAFDESEPLQERRDKSRGIQYSYVGLKRPKIEGKAISAPKSPTMLKNEFIKSLEICRKGAKNELWKKALVILESDPIFREADVTNVIQSSDKEEEARDKITNLFRKLSSGHKIVLLTISRLVETVEERSLVLIDEPEAHLHPPLLSAFIRALSDLLVYKNAVAFIATHSPVVLQEVPKNCVWKLRRNGQISTVERLEIESFGENIGVLTREVFGLEVTQSGFHKLLSEYIKEPNVYYEQLLHVILKGQLGMEGRAILRGLLSERETE